MLVTYIYNIKWYSGEKPKLALLWLLLSYAGDSKDEPNAFASSLSNDITIAVIIMNMRMNYMIYINTLKA